MKVIIKAFDKKPKLIMDSGGIFYYQWPDYIEWKHIISTYILEQEEGEHTTQNLLVYFHDAEDDIIKQKLAPLEGLRTDTVEVSYFVEHIKMKAGFPTQPSHY